MLVRDALPFDVRDLTQHGRGAPRPYQTHVLGSCPLTSSDLTPSSVPETQHATTFISPFGTSR